MPENLKTDVLIIGGGPVGITATNVIKKLSPETDVTILRPEPHSLIYCALPYAIEGLFPLEKTFKSDDLVTDTGANLIKESATGVDRESKTVTTDGDKVIEYEKLLIATGALPLVPPIPGADLDRVFTVKTVSDCVCVMNAVSECKECVATGGEDSPTAVVVGSGAIGIEQAIAYARQGIKVHLVEMQGHPLPQLIDEDMAAPVIEELEKMGIEMHLGAGLKAISGNEAAGRLELSDGSVINLEEGRDFVLLAVGMRPDIGIFENLDLETGKDGIVVGENMRTSVPDIWAAGDCTQFWSGIDGETIPGKLATNAVPMAKIAARDICGKPAAYPGFFNGAATVVGDVRVGGTGFSESFAPKRGFDVFVTYGETATRFPMMPGAGKVRVKLVWEKGTKRILGGQVVGSEAVAERIDLITLAVQQKLSAKDLAQFSYSAQPWQTFFPAKNAIVEAASNALSA